MDEAKKKQLQNVLVLAGLVVVLVIIMVVVVPKLSGGGAKTPGQTAAAQTAATNMASAGLPPKGASSVPSPGSTSAAKLNPNMWRVYALMPAKNPFVQQESWYAATFKKLLPGYPELRNSGFFDKPGEVLPNLNAIFGKDVKFDKIELQRQYRESNYTLNGFSKDNKMATTLTGREKMPANIDLTFDGQGNPIRKDINNQIIPEGNLGPDGLPLNPNSPGGMLGPGGMSLPGVDGQGQGQSMAVHGVNIMTSGKASALLNINGKSQIVRLGDVVRPHYKVTKITKGGVEFKDTQTGATKFVELKAPVKENPNQSAAPLPFLQGLSL